MDGADANSLVSEMVYLYDQHSGALGLPGDDGFVSGDIVYGRGGAVVSLAPVAFGASSVESASTQALVA